jgi:hypothetical protein
MLVLCFTYLPDDLKNATCFQDKEQNWSWILTMYCIYGGQPCWNHQASYMIDMVDCFIHFLASYCTWCYCFSAFCSCPWLNNATPAYLSDSISSFSKHYPSCPTMHAIWQFYNGTHIYRIIRNFLQFLGVTSLDFKIQNQHAFMSIIAFFLK